MRRYPLFVQVTGKSESNSRDRRELDRDRWRNGGGGAHMAECVKLDVGGLMCASEFPQILLALSKTQVYIYECIFIYVYIQIYMYAYVYMYILTSCAPQMLSSLVMRRTHFNSHMYICIYIHIYADIYTYVYMYTYSHSRHAYLSIYNKCTYSNSIYVKPHRNSNHAHFRCCQASL